MKLFHLFILLLFIVHGHQYATASEQQADRGGQNEEIVHDGVLENDEDEEDAKEEEEDVEEEIPADVTLTTWDIIRTQGREVTMNAAERRLTRVEVQDLIDDLIGFMHLMQLRELDDDEQARQNIKYLPVPGTLPDPNTQRRFLSLFDQLLLNQPIIYNFVQPTHPDHDTPEFISPNEYTDSVPVWFNEIEDIMVRNIDWPDVKYQYSPRLFASRTNYVHVILELGFFGRCDVGPACPAGYIDKRIELSVLVELEDQVGEFVDGEPIRHKIRYIDRVEDEEATIFKRQNWWMFANLQANTTTTSAMSDPVDDLYQDLHVSPGHAAGISGSLSVFFGDTARFAGEDRLWDVGFDIGVGFSRQDFSLDLDHYEQSIAMEHTPIQELDLYGGHLDIYGRDIRQSASLDVLSIPVSLIYKQHFSRSRTSALVVQGGASYNLLINNDISHGRGSISGHGRNIRFVDSDDFDAIDQVTDLPEYGFGTEFPVELNENVIDPFGSDYIAAHLRVGFHWRQNKFSRINYTITPWITLAVTDIIDLDEHVGELGYQENIRASENGPVIPIDHLGGSLESMRPFAFGIDLGISYNFVENRLRPIR